MAMFADTMSNFDLHMRNRNTNGLVLLSNHRRPLRSRDFEKNRRINLLRICNKSETPLLLMIKHMYQIKVNILFHHMAVLICHY